MANGICDSEAESRGAPVEVEREEAVEAEEEAEESICSTPSLDSRLGDAPLRPRKKERERERERERNREKKRERQRDREKERKKGRDSLAENAKDIDAKETEIEDTRNRPFNLSKLLEFKVSVTKEEFIHVLINLMVKRTSLEELNSCKHIL